MSSGRILAVDPGEKRHGLALSDPKAQLAKPLTILKHVSRPLDAAAIASIAREHDVQRIIVGQSLDMDGKPNVSGRRAARLAAALASQTEIPIQLWNEDFSTRQALVARRTAGLGRQARSKPIDDLAAAALLQDFLNHNNLPDKHSP